jgi:hypothetical protein
MDDTSKKKKKVRIGNFFLGGNSHHTGDAAFTPATPHDLHHSRANTDSHNSHSSQHTKIKKNTMVLCKMALRLNRHVPEDTLH